MDGSREPQGYAESLAFLYNRIDYERNATMSRSDPECRLQRMRDLLTRLGNPERQLPAAHIAGTKGKGSTAALIASVLESAGYRVGVYSSPHLQRLEERFVVNGRHCSQQELVDLIAEIRPVVHEMETATGTPGGGRPTFFEICTAVAMLHFIRREVDIAVLEVGLGGRLDSTNVCMPSVSIITSISYDHTRQLGKTLESISAEKAGIMKPGIPVISGVTEPAAAKIIQEIADERGSRLIVLGQDFTYNYEPAVGTLGLAPGPGRLSYTESIDGTKRRYQGLSISMLGNHQAANAAVSVAALSELQRAGWNIDEASVEQGLLNARCAARVEVLGERPTVIVDSAHNAASVRALISTLKESFAAHRRFLVFATTQEKDYKSMLSLLLPEFDAVIVTRYQHNPRWVDPNELESAAKQVASELHQTEFTPKIVACPDPATAWSTCRPLADPDDLICITGSFFLAAEMRPMVAKECGVLEPL